MGGANESTNQLVPPQGCSWPGMDALMQAYHDTEWGVPTRAVDYFDVKGDIEAAFAPSRLRFVKAAARELCRSTI